MRLIRYRLLTIVVIGVIMSALSLLAVVRVLTLTSSQRYERAREAVDKEVERLAAAGPGERREALSAPPMLGMVGMRAGYWDGRGALDLGAPLLGALPGEWQRPVARALSQSRADSGEVLVETPFGPSVVIVAARPAADGGVVWAGLLVSPPHFYRFWLTTVTLLALATAFLFTSAVWALVSFKRSANALHRCLVGLAADLSTPVPPLRIRELSEVADGIRHLAESLRHAREEQERLGHELAQKERLAALGRVVAGVAHEVRNPLASIKLRLDLAATGAALPPAAERAISHASSEISRLDRLVADLLVVSGRHLGPRQRTSIGTLVRARADALSPWAAVRGVSFYLEGDETAVVDSESVARAVDNLLRNAVEASPPSATVWVHVVGSPERVTVRVEDTGPGVTRGDELFEPFFTTKPDGTGLGLAISRAIARAHGGDVTYSRKSVRGVELTRFELSLGRGQSVPVEEAA